MIRQTASISVGFAVLLLLTSGLFAQVADDTSGAMPESPGPASAEAAAAKPFASFTGIGTGTYDDVGGPCPGVICSSGDTCECLSITGATLKASALGNATFAAKININLSSLTANGVSCGMFCGFCDLATGPATITAANGDTVTLDLTTDFCVGFHKVNFEEEGGWTVVGATGKLAAAAGTGVITLTGAELTEGVTDIPVAVSMNGVFHK